VYLYDTSLWAKDESESVNACRYEHSEFCAEFS
jgi:hypothetical protein